MPIGEHLTTCLTCFAKYICGDCITHECDECYRKRMERGRTTPDGTSKAGEASDTQLTIASTCVRIVLGADYHHNHPTVKELALAIDAHTAAKDSEIAALRAENRELISQLQRLQPAGSPPPLAGLELAKWIRSEVGKELLALRKEVERLKADRKMYSTGDEGQLEQTGDEQIADILESLSDAAKHGVPVVRVREEGGPESPAASVSVTLIAVENKLRGKDAEIILHRKQIEALKEARKAWCARYIARINDDMSNSGVLQTACLSADARCRELGVTVDTE